MSALRLIWSAWLCSRGFHVWHFDTVRRRSVCIECERRPAWLLRVFHVSIQDRRV